MRSRIIVGTLLVLGVLAVGTVATTGDGVAPSRQWTVINFASPVLVNGEFLMGPYMIMHDRAKEARGEPCTTFYRFDPRKGPQEATVWFQCKMVHRSVAARTTLSTSLLADGETHRLTEYQFAADAEGHGLPDAR